MSLSIPNLSFQKTWRCRFYLNNMHFILFQQYNMINKKNKVNFSFSHHNLLNYSNWWSTKLQHQYIEINNIYLQYPKPEKSFKYRWSQKRNVVKAQIPNNWNALVSKLPYFQLPQNQIYTKICFRECFPGLDFQQPC